MGIPQAIFTLKCVTKMQLSAEMFKKAYNLNLYQIYNITVVL